jgi:O-antigen/teichoic acid export membrane protein
MEGNRLIRNVSSNTFQLIFNQLFGLLIFYALSKGLEKDVFGEVNWAFALFLTVFGILNFGIDQVMVRKIAAGDDRQPVFSAYLIHVLTSGLFFYLLLLIVYFLFPVLFSTKHLLLYIGIGKLFIFISAPFKQVAIGLERFTSFMYMSVVSNLVRGVGLLVLLLLGMMTVKYALIILVAGDLAELIICIIIGKGLLLSPLKTRWDKQFQASLLKEALPQTGVVVFAAIMSRLDWILIGVIVSGTALAEYSFAWKMYEVSTLPLLIIAPLMIPMFTRLFLKPGNNGDPSFLLEWQVLIASFVGLLLNLCWVPVIDFITDGKYGAVNSSTIFILSLGMPVLYVNNYLWTINFARGKLKLIFRVMAFSFVANVAGCLLLIPFYGKEGAAAANFMSLVVQLIFYLRVTGFSLSTYRRLFLFRWPLLSLVCGFVILRYIDNPFTGILLAVLLFTLFIIVSRQVKGSDWKTLQSHYK